MSMRVSHALNVLTLRLKSSAGSWKPISPRGFQIDASDCDPLYPLIGRSKVTQDTIIELRCCNQDNFVLLGDSRWKIKALKT